MERNQHIYGLELDPETPFPENWTPLEAIVVTKCLDENGEVDMFFAATPSLNSWEGYGMLTDAADTLRDGWKETEDDDGP